MIFLGFFEPKTILISQEMAELCPNKIWVPTFKIDVTEGLKVTKNHPKTCRSLGAGFLAFFCDFYLSCDISFIVSSSVAESCLEASCSAV